MALYANRTTSGAVKAEAGTLLGVMVNSNTNGTLRFNDGASGTTSAGVKATGVLTSSGVFTNGHVAVIHDQTYTFVTALSGAAYEVLIGANAAASLDNFKVAINAGAGAGTVYGTGTIGNVHVTATTNTDTAQTIEAKRIGTYANTFATTETLTNVACGAVTMESGAESSLLIN